MPKKEKIIDVPGKMTRCLKILFWEILHVTFVTGGIKRC